jgi:hypothetical protein
MKKIFVFSSISILVSMLMTLYYKSDILTEKEFFNHYSSQLSYEQIQKMMSFRKEYEWLGYILTPIFYFIKISLISLCLYTGILLANIKNLSLAKIFSAVVLADILFLIPQLIKIVWFTFQPNYTLEDLQYFMPISLLNIFNPKEIEPWLVYPLQSINVWEVAFWFALAFELKAYFEEDFTKSFGIVLASYGSGFMIWILFVVFLTLNFT